MLGKADALAAALRGEKVAGYTVDFSLNVGDPSNAKRRGRRQGQLPVVANAEAIKPENRLNEPMVDRLRPDAQVQLHDLDNQLDFIRSTQVDHPAGQGDVVLLVNCNQCCNRSPTIVLLWLVTGEGLTLREAYKKIFRAGHRGFDPLPPYRR